MKLLADVTAQLIMIRMRERCVFRGEQRLYVLKVDVHKLGSLTSVKKLADVASAKWNFDLLIFSSVN